jgi:hypothetical protein
MIQNITLRTPPTPEEIRNRGIFLEQNRRDAAALSERLRTAQQQRESAPFQNSLVEKTMLSLEQLISIREWLNNNS